jgi:NADPH-dependent ferric siderophore reductase
MPRSHSKPVKPIDPHVLRLTVVRRQVLSDSFVRVTLGGDDLARFTPMGFDQWFRLFIPQRFDEVPRLPTTASARWWPQVLAMPAHDRPHVRNYTVAEFRADPAELDADFVMHEPGRDDRHRDQPGAGVAARWAAQAEPGQSVGLLDQGRSWNPVGELDSVLLVADETALPGLAGIAASLPAHVRGTIVAEVPADGDRRELARPPGVEVRWIARGDAAHLPGAAALETASALEIEGTPQVWVSGEQTLASGLRRALVSKGVPKSHITFCGYWRSGVTLG